MLIIGCSQLNSTLKKAQKVGFHKVVWHTKPFFVVSWIKITQNNTKLPLVIYIEGDGYAWRNRYQASSNPTPKNPISLKLAIRDKGKQILYLARPCQYLSATQLQDCDVKYWTSHRLSKEVVNSLNEVIDQLLAQINPTEIGLIGYSGGGAIAALIAEKRKDIDWFITLAGNLDHQTWTQVHHVTPLNGSLNALDIAYKIKDIPQQHWLGTKDQVIPLTVIQSYLKQAQHPEWLKQVKGYDHHCCWEDHWPNLLCKETSNPQNKPWLAYFCR